MATTYTDAPEVRNLARELISEHHSHLSGVRVDFLFRDKAKVTAGVAELGAARKVTGLNAYLAGHAVVGLKSDTPFFVIEIARDLWGDLTASQRRALVDHELCHLWIDEKGNLQILKHDVEEFTAILSRHGLWLEDLKQFLRAAGDAAQRRDAAEREAFDELAAAAREDGLDVRIVAGGSD